MRKKSKAVQPSTPTRYSIVPPSGPLDVTRVFADQTELKGVIEARYSDGELVLKIKTDTINVLGG